MANKLYYSDGTQWLLVDDAPASVGVAIEDEGTEVRASASRINFTGAGVSVADAGAGEVTVDIPGGGGSSGGGGGSLLIPNGGSVPAGTPYGTIIYEEPYPGGAFAQAAARSPLILLGLDELAGNFPDSGSNGAAFSPGTGVVRGKPPLQNAGYAVSGPGSGSSTAGAIASLASNPAALAGGVGTLMVCVRFNASTAKGCLIKAGGSSTQGWALDCGAATNGTSPGNYWLFARNGITWSATNIQWYPNTVYVAALTRDASGNGSLWVNGTKVWASAGGLTINAMAAGGPAIGSDYSTSTGVLSSTVDMDWAGWWPTVLPDADLAAITGTLMGRSPKGFWDGSAIKLFAA